ncbi:MAG TPA: winged helix-turn-helix domain-containing protein [Candidatus Corynebacterium avicola]|uniref:Winged helix-turn-helix domain-containing protein n=1 Tax=Candidatus Corynebacterium avicola TaxID=2838527 RepID=A0A9D1RMA5_9CORY|nr:winged helix-turn-helix domain-containing protein [Candidatus Corynebacterium avicola]
MNDHQKDLRTAVEELAARVAALETAGPTAEDGQDASSPTVGKDIFWALNGLKERSTEHGEVMIVGDFSIAEGPVEWQESRDPTAMLETNWGDHAASFAALGNPVRLELLRHILNGTHRTADLAALDELGTTGQLHHHLRQLVATGWVRQSGRGTYEVPVTRIVPLMACLVGVS